MIALIILLFTFIWLIVVHILAWSISKLIYPRQKIHKLLYSGLFVSLMILTFADEFLDQYQIREICKPENLLIYDPEKVKGKTVVFRKNVPNENITDPVIAYINNDYYEDANTGELLIKDITITIKGGWLSRWIGFNRSSPITYRGICLSQEYKSLFAKLNVKEIFK